MNTEFELKQQGKISRLTNATFKFDQRLANSYYSAEYFIKTQKIIEKYRPDQKVLMQFFQKEDSILCGIDEVIALLHTFARNPEQLKITALNDGDHIKPFESVMTIEGHYADYGYLEGVIDGILARRTSVATNSYKLVTAARDHGSVIFMGDRDDTYNQQQGDGYAAYIGGIKSHATDAMCEWIGGSGKGTMPHALIQQFDGDLIAACEAFHELYPDDNLVALIDYNNDVINDGLMVARHFNKELFAVRVDTSGYLTDKYFTGKEQQYAGKKINGTNPSLIKALRKAFDKEGFQHVKIIVSGGFNHEKVKLFIEEQTPVDYFGIGSSILKVNIGFTGDCVLLNDKNQAKVGRQYNPNPRLQIVNYNSK